MVEAHLLYGLCVVPDDNWVIADLCLWEDNAEFHADYSSVVAAMSAAPSAPANPECGATSQATPNNVSIAEIEATSSGLS
jgi:hypothetical protein